MLRRFSDEVPFPTWRHSTKWLSTGANRPKDRSKRGQRRKIGKGSKRAYDRLHKNAHKPWPNGHRNNAGK